MHANEGLPFFASLLLLLALARMLGEVMEQCKQPAIIGEIMAGILLGPSVLNIIHVNTALEAFSQLGIFLLVILAGLEIDFKVLLTNLLGKNCWIGIFAFIIPLLSGAALGIVFELTPITTIFISLCIAITALPVSIRILSDLKKINTQIGQRIISGAILQDVLALIILGVILDTHESEHQKSYWEMAKSTSFAFFKAMLFVGFVGIVSILFHKFSKKSDYYWLKINKLSQAVKGKETFFAIIFVFILLFASFSEVVGLHFVVGAFFGAMLLSREILGTEGFEQVEKSVSGLAIGFLAPIFFAVIGLEFNLGAVENWYLFSVIIMLAFLSKIIGGYLGGKLAGMSNTASLTLGVGMNARGIMELVIANIAYSQGFINQSIFSMLVIMGVASTVITPFLLGILFKKLDQK